MEKITTQDGYFVEVVNSFRLGSRTVCITLEKSQGGGLAYFAREKETGILLHRKEEKDMRKAIETALEKIKGMFDTVEKFTTFFEKMRPAMPKKTQIFGFSMN
jgi:hypothetical protein